MSKACLLALALVVGASEWSRATMASEPSTPAPATVADLYVAPGGKDSNRGSADEPLATLAKARDVVREKVAVGLTQNVPCGGSSPAAGDASSSIPAHSSVESGRSFGKPINCTYWSGLAQEHHVLCVLQADAHVALNFFEVGRVVALEAALKDEGRVAHVGHLAASVRLPVGTRFLAETT